MILFKVDNDEMEGLVLQILCLHLSLLIKQALSEAGEVKFTAKLMWLFVCALNKLAQKW